MLVASGLPLAMGTATVPRPRVIAAAPLPVGMSGERELLDVFLVERLAVADVRRGLTAALPAGHGLVDLHDVWLGEPALPGQLAAAEYRIELAETPDLPAAEEIRNAGRALLAAATIRRTRDKGGRSVEYDLRPLLDAVEVLDAGLGPGRPATLRIRTRFDPERGVGRPDEVLAALADAAAAPIRATSIVRERLILRT